MDWGALSEKAISFIKKYRYVILVLAVGMVLMALPSGTAEPETVTATEPAQTETLEERLAGILSQIDGAGRVQVLLTESQGEKVVYKEDVDSDTGENSSSLRSETVIVSDADRAEAGLVEQVNPPVYQGAVIVCQGGDRAAVRLAIVEAVASATGLSADKITVLKMK